MPSFRRNSHGVFKINGIGALKSAKSLALCDFGVWNGVAGGLDATGSLRSRLVRTCGPLDVAACSWIFWLYSPPSGLLKGNSSVRNRCGCWDRDHRFLRWVFWTRNRLVVCAVNDFRVGAVTP